MTRVHHSEYFLNLFISIFLKHFAALFNSKLPHKKSRILQNCKHRRQAIKFKFHRCSTSRESSPLTFEEVRMQFKAKVREQIGEENVAERRVAVSVIFFWSLSSSALFRDLHLSNPERVPSGVQVRAQKSALHHHLQCSR